MKGHFCGCLVILLLATNAAGQTTPPTPPTPITPDLDLQQIDDFRKLFDEREVVLGQRDALSDKVWDLWTRMQNLNLPRLSTLETSLVRLNEELERAQKASSPKEDLASLQLRIDDTTAGIKMAQEYENARGELETKNRRLFRIEQQIASQYDASRDNNKFRTSVTYVFGILVCFVIVGFYVIAWYKEGVATTIFSGELGMQFITLFLIVIAIILFGIMGTLAGRELAALLGGLSGYILGRATGRNRESDRREGVN
jgi:hypothetical protein